MNILALIGSPRKAGNTDILVDQILKGCRETGYETQKLYLYDYEISGCVDCRACKQKDYRCVIEDGMREIYPKMEQADLLIFGTPVYWYGPTGKMKLLIDRMRPFIANKRLRGKRAVVVVPCEEGPAACGALLEMFRMSFAYLGMEFSGDLLATAYEKAEIADKHEELQKAYALGLSL